MSLASPEPRLQVDARRRLVYRFFALPHRRRLDVVQSLGLPEPEERTLPEPERFRRFFARAREAGLLAALWAQVEALHPDGDPTRNPFGAPGSTPGSELGPGPAPRSLQEDAAEEAPPRGTSGESSTTPPMI